MAARRRISVVGLHSIRDLAFDPAGRLLLADPHAHRMWSIPWPSPRDFLAAAPVAECGGALSVQRTGPWLVADCLLDHRVLVWDVGDDGELGEPAVVEHDGPVWSVAAALGPDEELRLLLGGVEDHPLDRSDGSFGYVDSFVFAYTVDRGPAEAPLLRRGAAVNVAEHGVVTPKHVAWRPDDGEVPVAVATGYGAEHAATLRFVGGLEQAPAVEVVRLVPGVTAMIGDATHGLAADPLLDAWVVVRDGSSRVVPVAWPGDDRTPSERLGEALAFTTLMAPGGGTSEGHHSRFTCETCHFEGRVDGRTHFTGRGDVHATTKTLRGLFVNRPHFSRALDRTTAEMVDNEFEVVSRGTGRDASFSLTRADAPWLDALGAPPDPLPPLVLRRALLDFVAAFTPEPNPAVAGLDRFDAAQAEGARVFAEHCEGCHAARLVADDPDTRVPPERWQTLVLSEAGPIVWGRDGRERTGVTPYVHAEGARVPSLRRLWVKRPYLTNGSAPTLDDVLSRVRLGARDVHDGGEGLQSRPLTRAERDALGAFLRLL